MDRIVTVNASLVASVETKLLELKAERKRVAASLRPATKAKGDHDARQIAARIWELDRILEKGSPAKVRQALSRIISQNHARVLAWEGDERGQGIYWKKRRSSFLQSSWHPQRHAADQPIPLGKGAAHGLGLRRGFAQQASGRGHLVGQLPVLGRIDICQPAPQHRDGSSTGSQRAAMRRGVDAAQAADNRESARARLPAKRSACATPYCVA